MIWGDQMELRFKTERVSDRVTRIYAFNTELMYLVEGDERAVLIDTGSGFGSLKNCIEGLTAKPVTVLLTHGHTDHALGSAEFEDVYISPLDKEAYAIHSQLQFRKNSGAMWPDFHKLSDEQIVPAMPFEQMKSLRHGDCFDLGGVTVEIYACPGHTAGSLTMLIKEEHMLLLGDACNYLTFLFDEFSSSVAEYKEALLKLEAETCGKYDTVLLSHGDGLGVPNMIKNVIEVCDIILDGKSDEQPFDFLGSKAHIAKAMGPEQHRIDGGAGNIVYNKNHIR